jgi:hypothetical protein
MKPRQRGTHTISLGSLLAGQSYMMFDLRDRKPAGPMGVVRIERKGGENARLREQKE